MLGMTSTYRLNGNFVFRHPFLPVCYIAGRSDGDAFFHGIKFDNILELCLKFHAALFEESYIGLTVSQQFTLEIENVSFRYFFVIPFMEFIFACCGHTIRVVVRFVRHVPT